MVLTLLVKQRSPRNITDHSLALSVEADVLVVPYIVTSIEEAEAFESIAQECNADYYETVLHNERADAIARLLERGKWGGASSPSITNKNLSIIEKDFANMEAVLKKRPNTVRIPLKGNSPDTTYQQLLQIVEP